MRLFKNKTIDRVIITCENHTLFVLGGEEVNLSLVFTIAQLQECEMLIELLGQGINKYSLNDGGGELSVINAIDLIRNIYPRELLVKSLPTTNVFSDGYINLPKMINLYFNKNDAAIVTGNFKRIMTYTVPSGYAGYLIGYKSWQNEVAKSRLVAETPMGTLNFVTNTYTSDSLYVTPEWGGTIEAEVTTTVGSTGSTRTVTVTYTNDKNQSGCIGTFSIPKNSIVGTRFILQLQSGDIGVTSIQNMSIDLVGNAGAIKVLGFVQLAFHNNLSTTTQSETNYNPGSVVFPTATVLGFEYAGGTVSKQRIIEALIQLVVL